MTFEGSMTPPLSDDENWDKLSCESTGSPVLCQQSKSEWSAANSFTIRNKLYEKLRNSGECIELFYEAAMYISYLEKDSSGHLSSNTNSNNEIFLTDLLSSTETFHRNCKENQSIDQLFHVLEMFLALSTKVSIVVEKGPRLLYHTSLKNRFSDEIRTLHNCKNTSLIEWFHSFCNINSLLLDIAETICVNRPSFDKIQVAQCNGTNVLENGNVLVKIVSRILHELALLSSICSKEMHDRENVNTSTWEKILKSNPYPCECFANLLLKCSKSSLAENEFWNIVTSIVNSTIQNPTCRMESAEVAYSTDLEFTDIQTALWFSWWWIQAMPLRGEILLCHNLINRLMRLSLSHCLHDDDIFTFQLKCYVVSLKRLRSSVHSAEWTSSELASFLLLWRHTCQRLTSKLGKVLSGIKQHTVKELHVSEWIQECRSLREIHNCGKMSTGRDSFQMFLVILDFILSENDGHVWNQLRDRLLPRLQTTTMKQLDEIGLHRFFSIIIVIVTSCPQSLVQDVLSQCVLLLDHCTLDKSEYWRKQKLIFSGLYAISHTCIERRVSFEVVAEKLGKAFAVISRRLGDQATRKDQWHECFKIFIHYLEQFTSVLQVSRSFEHGQMLLIPPQCIRRVTDSIGSSETSPIVNFLAETFASLRLHASKQESGKNCFKDLCMLIAGETLPWIKKQFLDADDPKLTEKMTEIVCDLTLLAVTFARDGQSTSNRFSLLELWKYFASEGHIDHTIRCHYIGTVLQDMQALRVLNEDYASSSVQSDKKATTEATICDVAIQGWVKCSITLADDQSPYRSLNCAIAKLDALKIFIDLSNPVFNFQTFLCSLARKRENSKNFLEKIRWTNMASRWFGPAADSSIQVLKQTHTSSETIYRVYRVLGIIFEQCSLLLYTMGKPSFVSKILDYFVFDPFHSSLSDRRLASTCANALHRNLEKFVLGAIAIGTKDFYVNKSLKRIISLHLTRWPCVLANQEKHPFLRILVHRNADVASEMLCLFHNVLKNDTQSEKLALVIEILYEWIVLKKMAKLSLTDVPDFKPTLQQARTRLRFNQALMEKINIVLDVFNNSTIV